MKHTRFATFKNDVDTLRPEREWGVDLIGASSGDR
jgi:hypothetical protein